MLCWSICLELAFKLPPCSYNPCQCCPGIASCTKCVSWPGEDGHLRPCHPTLGCTTVIQLPAHLERGADAEDWEVNLSYRPVPRGCMWLSRGYTSIFFLFVCFLLSHLPGEPLSPRIPAESENSHQSCKACGQVEACGASTALGSRYMMSPWWLTKALWGAVYVHPMGSIGTPGTTKIRDTRSPIPSCPGHSIPSLGLAKGSIHLHCLCWPLYTSHFAKTTL